MDPKDPQQPQAGEEQPQAGTQTPGDPASPESTTSTDSAALEQQIADLRKEAAKYRTERNALQAKEEERTNAEKSEIEKAQAEVAKRDERITSLEGRLKRSSFIEQFGANGRLAWAMAQDLNLDTEFDEDLKATNVDAIRKELKKLEPQTFGDGPADAGSRTNGGGAYQGPPGVGRLTHAYNNQRK